MLENGDIKSVIKLQKLNKESKESIIEYVNDKVGLVTDSYFSFPIKSIVISYGIRKGNLPVSSLELKPASA